MDSGAGPLSDADTISRARNGLGCLCRHEWVEPGRGLHCDGPLTKGGGGLCWTCKCIRRCGNYMLEREPVANATTPLLDGTQPTH